MIPVVVKCGLEPKPMATKHNGFKCQDVSFYSDGYRLVGKLHLPRCITAPVVIGAHGLMSSRRSPKLLALANRCNAHGLAFFRFDHRGCGESQGDFSQVTSLKGRCNDIIAAKKTLEKIPGIGKGTGLFGSSMGGAAALLASETINPQATVIVAAPLQSNAIGAGKTAPLEEKRLQKTLTGVNLEFDIRNQLSGIQNILIFHGIQDTVVPFGHAKTIHRQAKGPKRLILQKSGDHRMSRKTHQEAFVREAAIWFKRFLY